MLLALAARGGGTSSLRYVGMAHKPTHAAAEMAAAGIELEAQRAPLGVLWQQLALPRRLRRGDIDLLWSPLLTLPLLCPVPAVVTVHDLTTLLFPEHHRAKVRWSILPFLRPSIERARRIVTLSRSAADDIAAHFPQSAGKVRVIYPGIDPEFVPGAPAAIEATRRELGAPEGYLLYAGTLEPRKDVPRLLDAWEALAAGSAKTPPLVLAGPYGWGNDSLLARLETLRPRGVHYVGRVERARLVQLFQAARAFVYPSLYEGFGLPPAEALACGVPAIVSRSSSLPEVVGEAGLLATPGDTGSLAAAIRSLLEDPAREADLRGRTLGQAANFRWDRAALAMEEVFREALG
jgi:glycosyltransferase involved in cell wall biosynthesis